MTAQWYEAIRKGLVASHHQPEADALLLSDVRVAFFGDLFEPEGAREAAVEDYTVSDLSPGPEQDLVRVLYEAAVGRDTTLAADRELLGPGNLALQAMLHQLLKSPALSGVAEKMLIRDLKQVNQYLDDPQTKDMVLDRVHAAVEEDTQIMIGHSLGSVVAYEYVCRYRPAGLSLLVTMGSPLGIPNLIFERLTPAPIDGEGAWAGVVRWWRNVADEEDVVALKKRLKDLFPGPGAKRVTDRLVDNGDQPHAADRYLTSVEVGDPIGAVL